MRSFSFRLILLATLSVLSSLLVVLASDSVDNSPFYIAVLPKISVLAAELSKIDLCCSHEYFSKIPVVDQGRAFYLPAEPTTALLTRLIFILDSDKKRLNFMWNSINKYNIYDPNCQNIFKNVHFTLNLSNTYILNMLLMIVLGD